MKIKNLFYVAVMFLFATSLFTSCEQHEGQKPEFAIDSVYLYGNCTDPVNNREDGRFGMNASYTMSTATMLNGADLAAHGTKIIGVRALIDGEVSDAEVYVAGSLDMSDILTRKSFEWVDEGWQYVLFDEPLDITGSDLYVGYTITSSGFVIGLEPASKMTSTEYMYWNNQWFKLSDMGTKGYWSIQVILQGGDYSAETQYAISVDEVSVPTAVRANDEFKAMLEVRNTGVRTISKLEAIINQKQKNTSVVYVGDGINDTPALKLADVGVAIGGLGNDEAVEVSDVVLLNNNMNNLIKAIKISKFTKKILVQNIVFALTVKFVALIIGMLGIIGSYGMLLGVFADVGVCLITIFNTLRILKYGGKNG